MPAAVRAPSFLATLRSHIPLYALRLHAAGCLYIKSICLLPTPCNPPPGEAAGGEAPKEKKKKKKADIDGLFAALGGEDGEEGGAAAASKGSSKSGEKDKKDKKDKKKKAADGDSLMAALDEGAAPAAEAEVPGEGCRGMVLIRGVCNRSSRGQQAVLACGDQKQGVQ